jgi:polyisoprenoid-binding protein YceI
MPQPGASFPGARPYRVVAEESLLQVYAYRGGAMARLGHNHVVASRHLGGVVFLTDDLLQTRFDISFPVAELTIDEPALREEAGPDFPPSIPQSARDGTRNNLLSEAALNATRFPTIRLRAVDVMPTATAFEAGVEITIKDQTRQVRVPVEVERSDGQIVARGEFPLKQSELGLKPFTVALGTLVVLDDLRVKFEITARE